MTPIEPCFNDLSIQPLCSNEQEVIERFSKFAQVLSFCSDLGIKRFRIDESFRNLPITTDKHVYDYFSDNRTSTDVMFILSMVRKPYIPDDTPEIAKYVNCDIKLQKDHAFIDAYGLSCAYVSDSFSVGFPSETFWSERYLFDLKIHNDLDNTYKEDKVFCISDICHFEEQAIIEWYVSNYGVVSKKVSMSSSMDDLINLRKDHGRDKLARFARIIIKEPYVKRIVNSIAFDSHAKSFIESVDENLINLRFVNSNKGYGMVVETSANNKLLNLYYAEDLRQKYQSRRLS